MKVSGDNVWWQFNLRVTKGSMVPPFKSGAFLVKKSVCQFSYVQNCFLLGEIILHEKKWSVTLCVPLTIAIDVPLPHMICLFKKLHCSFHHAERLHCAWDSWRIGVVIEISKGRRLVPDNGYGIERFCASCWIAFDYCLPFMIRNSFSTETLCPSSREIIICIIEGSEHGRRLLFSTMYEMRGVVQSCASFHLVLFTCNCETIYRNCICSRNFSFHLPVINLNRDLWMNRKES